MTNRFLAEAARAPQFTDAFGRLLTSLSRILALGGVLTLCGLALMLTFTIVVRKLFSWQVNGDNEIVRMFAAFSITALFPWCQLTGSNIVVDLLTSGLPARKNRILDQIGSLLLGAVLLVLTWRTGLLVLESRASGAFSPLLAWPVWMFQALMLPGLLLTAINGFYLGLSPRAMTLRTEFFLLSEEVE